MNVEKLAKLQQTVRIGGKGTPRRKIKKSHKTPAGDDKKVQSALKKLNSQPIPGIEVVNLFKEDGTVIHIPTPNVQGALACNTFYISGHAQEKELVDLFPDILPQLGADSMSSIRQLAANLKQSIGSNDDLDIPDLVQNFEEVSTA